MYYESRVPVPPVQPATQAVTGVNSMRHAQPIDHSQASGHIIPLLLAAVGFRFQQRWRVAERRHPTGRERMGSLTLQTLQEPICGCLGSGFEATALQPRLQRLGAVSAGLGEAQHDERTATTAAGAMLT